MQVYKESRRPSERAEQFLIDYISQSDHLPGDRLPSPRQIAAELGIGESTVRSVVRKWLRQGKLRSRQGSGIFICKSEAPPQRHLRIGGNVRNYQHTHPSWGGMIHLHALEAVMELGPRGSFTSLYSAQEVVNDLSDEEVVSRCQNLDGAILYQSSPHVAAIAAHCRKHRKPCVYLNPPQDDAVANFVALETVTAFYRASRALRESGRKRFALLINPSLDRAVTSRQRLSGVANGIGEALGEAVELRVITCTGFNLEDGHHAIEPLLKKGAYRPDAILCAGDGLALGALGALQAAGLKAGGEVSLISGAGFDPQIRERQVTTLLQPLNGIARNLVSMLLEMIEKHVVELPARILPVGLATGATTTDEENRRMEALFTS